MRPWPSCRSSACASRSTISAPAFASLSYLQSFPFDKIKIDRSFVREVPERADCLAIVRAVDQSRQKPPHRDGRGRNRDARALHDDHRGRLRRGARLLFQPPRAFERCRRGAGALPPQMPGDGAASLARPQPDGETGPPHPPGPLTSARPRPPSKEAAGGSTTRRPWRSHSGSAQFSSGLSVPESCPDVALSDPSLLSWYWPVPCGDVGARAAGLIVGCGVVRHVGVGRRGRVLVRHRVVGLPLLGKARLRHEAEREQCGRGRNRLRLHGWNSFPGASAAKACGGSASLARRGRGARQSGVTALAAPTPPAADGLRPVKFTACY